MQDHTEIIKNQLSIDQVIGAYIRLEPSGTGFKARCPFHNEKTASFSVTPEKGMFYCYGCQKGGDIFTFVQEIEKITFREALEKLARDAGVDITSTSSGTSNHKKIIEILAIAARFYHACLRSSPAVISYLEGRYMSRETIKDFMIGYSPGYTHLIRLLQKKFSNNDIIESGIGVLGNRGLYDRFSERVMFPIIDHQGIIVGFSARLLPGDKRADKTGKYINTPETSIYHKSKILFGYYRAKKTILEKKYAVLVEGNIDVVMLHQAGFTETVGVSGTACTKEQIILLQRLTQNIVLAFDQDDAGQKALHKTALMCLTTGLSVSVVVYGDKDPADTVQGGSLDWQKYLDKRKDYFSYLGEKLIHLDSSGHMNYIQQYVFPAIHALIHHTEKDQKVEFFARMLSWSVDAMKKDFNQYQNTVTIDTYTPESGQVLQKTLVFSEKDLQKNIYVWIFLEKENIINIENILLEYGLSELINKDIQPSATELAQHNFLVYNLNQTEKQKIFLRLCQEYRLKTLENRYQETMISLRDYEYKVNNHDQIYHDILEKSQQLLASIHTCRDSMHDQ
jgi:DNA primase